VDKKVRCSLLDKEIKVVSNPGLKCPDKMENMMWMNTSIPVGVLQNLIGVVIGNTKALNTRLCVLAPQLAGALAYNTHKTVF